jgi:hypothetical protein
MTLAAIRRIEAMGLALEFGPEAANSQLFKPTAAIPGLTSTHSGLDSCSESYSAKPGRSVSSQCRDGRSACMR